MENNIPKFLLAENPINNKKFEQYIYSARTGFKALIQAESVDMLSIIEEAESTAVLPLFFVSKSTGLPEFYLLRIIDQIDLPDDHIEAILKEAGKWYKNFLIWEEKQMFEGVEVKPVLKDYTPKVKGLKVLVSQAENMSIFIFRGRIRVFSSDKAGFKWLTDEFDIKQEDLSDGQTETVEDIEEIIMAKLED